MHNINKIIGTVIQGDCIEELKKIPDETIDCIFADPPYFMQTDGVLLRTDGTDFKGVDDHWDKFDDYKHYDKFSEDWLRECKRVLKKNGSIWVIGAFQNIYRIGYIMQNLGFWILNDVVWSKPNAVPNFGGTRFQNSHETMLWCTKSKKSKYTFNYKTMKKLNNDKQDKSVWDIGICIGSERIKNSEGKKAHATQKPEKLLYKVIISSTKPDEIVLDPFFGTGTTGAMAKMLGRRFIGIEREPEYIKVAEARISNVKQVEDEFTQLTLEVKPPKVPLKELIKLGFIKVGQEIFDKKRENIVCVLENGYVKDNEEELSIHKMSAKYLKLTNNNGWDYYWTDYKGEMVTINSLRYLAQDLINNSKI